MRASCLPRSVIWVAEMTVSARSLKATTENISCGFNLCMIRIAVSLTTSILLPCMEVDRSSTRHRLSGGSGRFFMSVGMENSIMIYIIWGSSNRNRPWRLKNIFCSNKTCGVFSGGRDSSYLARFFRLERTSYASWTPRNNSVSPGAIFLSGWRWRAASKYA